ncbi:cellulose synthase/poly-beta-1,6-N-acetylglucosamine synthase-like glycosyltransferase [Heliophilum fasciatum]|uniref:Cellulose synthase/poly-beta-1,6-N-acetylglucosamine synthase-like glycosyltransferase n=2 Tax=Heliophilum fasciatum TaxID=35700 RepID=A0A4R2S0E6_9FIRM|nr:cellulose synthase/poly-beta-1,6-N-acetylglucosamine synthase-like glycosyltransferase [Heliophilum fasciatum]TCP68889.1 cellulose synthase/poly-beta-1,6-N-acetylglucosamine synthase-like glycosyltransferase [Heliophilum fasciatum]
MDLWDHLFAQTYDPIMVPLQFLIIFCTFYYLFLSFFGLWKKKEKVVAPPSKQFALVVAAHNEQAVIGPLVENLKQMDYPRELYEIFIIADNCTDQTAAIAREAGAEVYERFNRQQRGKGYALEWMFEKIFRMERQFDAVVIFDADNLVKANFLTEMNNKLMEGHQIVQCYLDSKNPFDNWVTATFSIAFWHCNRLLQLARYNIGLSNILGGTGMCITTKLLREYGWGATSLTEDLEFSMKALMNGIKTVWAHEAVIYDEKPLTFMQSWNQRKRWAQGHVDIFLRYFPKLVWKGITTGDFRMLDGAMHLFQPLLVIFVTFFMVMSYIEPFHSNYTLVFNVMNDLNVWKILSYIQLAQPLIALMLDKVDRRSYKYVLLYPIFIYSWVPIVFLGFLHRNRREWSHTVHTRGLSYNEVVK